MDVTTLSEDTLKNLRGDIARVLDKENHMDAESVLEKARDATSAIETIAVLAYARGFRDAREDSRRFAARAIRKTFQRLTSVRPGEPGPATASGPGVLTQDTEIELDREIDEIVAEALSAADVDR